MLKINYNSLLKYIPLLLLLIFAGGLHASEKIIKQEKMTFGRCLNIISVSEDKLSIVPDISEVKGKSLVATFQLVDGILKILCDNENELLTVLTETN